MVSVQVSHAACWMRRIKLVECPCCLLTTGSAGWTKKVHLWCLQQLPSVLELCRKLQLLFLFLRLDMTGQPSDFRAVTHVLV